MKKISEKLVSDNAVSALSILKCVGLAYVITLLIFLVLAIFLTYTEFPETMIPAVTVVGTLISIMFAGSSVARRARTKGWLNGAIAGLTYMVILYLISSLTVAGFAIDQYVILMFIAGMVAGALGGIVGINIRKR